MPIPVGKAICLIRTQKGISQGAMFDLCGLRQSYISRVESGYYVPCLEMLERFADAFDTSVSKIIKYAERIERHAKHNAKAEIESTMVH